MTIRVFIADDHALFRDGLRALLQEQTDMEWVGDAGDGRECLNQLKSIRPDIVLMDISMPDMNGVEATRQVLSLLPECRIIMVTMLEDDASVFAALQAGARGYVLKGSNVIEMLNVIRVVADGQVLFGSRMADRLLAHFQKRQISRLPDSSTASSSFPDLTAREQELLILIAQGISNAEIARQLTISPITVRNHITNIFGKLQVTTRSEAIVKAHQAGLGQQDEERR